MIKYTTDRIGLAAYLISSGASLQDIELKAGWCWFILDASRMFVNQMASHYHSGNARIEPSVYCDRVLWLYKQFQAIKNYKHT